MEELGVESVVRVGSLSAEKLAAVEVSDALLAGEKSPC